LIEKKSSLFEIIVTPAPKVYNIVFEIIIKHAILIYLALLEMMKEFD